LAHDALIVRRHDDKQGPLGALYAGLFAARYDQALAVHSAMPVVEGSMIKGLEEAAEPRFDGVVTAAAGPGPFPAVYHKRCLKLLAQLWAESPAPPTVERFFKQIRIRTIDA
jgi:molybdopterin-guanine dinucleotide biosynthesis protein A